MVAKSANRVTTLLVFKHINILEMFLYLVLVLDSQSLFIASSQYVENVKGHKLDHHVHGLTVYTRE